MESHDAEFHEGTKVYPKENADRIQRDAFRQALGAVGVTLREDTFNMLSLPDLRSIYNCVVLSVE